MNTIKLTIALLTFNRAKYLEKMLNSIVNQTYKHFVVKIYDNCSDDNTIDIVKPYLSDNRFSYIRHEENIGSINNSNQAIRECKTDFLILMHDDDILEPGIIEKEMNIILSDPTINLVSTNVNYIDDQDMIIRKDVYHDIVGNDDIEVNKKEYINYYMNSKNFIACPTVLLRTCVLHNNDIYARDKVGRSADTFLWFEMNQYAGKFYYLSETLYNYRLHDGQDSRNGLYMIPMLKKPVYELLIKNGYSETDIKKWLSYVNGIILGDLRRNLFKRKQIRSLRQNVVILKRSEISFLFYFFIALSSPHFYFFVMKTVHSIKNKLLEIIKYS